MANTRSAEKNIRKTEKRTAANQATKSRVRTLRKKVLADVESGDATAAQVSLSAFASAVDKAAKVKILHSKTSSRLKSRLHAKVAAIGSAK